MWCFFYLQIVSSVFLSHYQNNRISREIKNYIYIYMCVCVCVNQVESYYTRSNIYWYKIKLWLIKAVFLKLLDVAYQQDIFPKSKTGTIFFQCPRLAPYFSNVQVWHHVCAILLLCFAFIQFPINFQAFLSVVLHYSMWKEWYYKR